MTKIVGIAVSNFKYVRKKKYFIFIMDIPTLSQNSDDTARLAPGSYFGWKSSASINRVYLREFGRVIPASKHIVCCTLNQECAICRICIHTGIYLGQMPLV